MKSLKISPILFFFALNVANSTFAQDKTASPEALSLKATPLITVSYLFQLFISLLIVFGLIYLASKYILPRIKVTTKGRVIEVVDRVGLEPQVTAYIIKAKDSSWLVVSSNKNVSVVSKIET